MASEITLSEAELVMRFGNEDIAELVLRALSPDNVPLPAGLEIDAYRDGEAVVFKVYCRRSVKSLLATLDDVASMAILALKTVKAIGGQKPS